ncbi:MAG TPA: efflux RND transporter periplasmic adaptor subunit [Xanthobacteraceae bacterium]|jgi:RND family efflux transporter MFP subunit
MCLVCSAVLIGALTISAFAADDSPSVEVETTPIRQQEVSNIVTAYGSVVASEDSMADISFPHSGEISRLMVRVGQKVRSGDPLVTITSDPATLQSYQKAVTALDFAQRELARMQSLRQQHLATNAQVATAQQAVADATVAVETERKLGNDEPTKSAVAPFDGYVAKIMAAPGDRLQANTAIMMLARTDQGVHIAVGLKPEDALRVEPGMRARITPVLSTGSPPLEGTVRQIGGTINPATKFIDAFVDVPQAGKLVTGESVTVAVILSTHKGYVVPRDAVLRDDKGSYIFQVANGRAKRVDVQTGIETDTLTEISGGFDPSLRVVALGNYELSDGMAVRETASTTSP